MATSLVVGLCGSCFFPELNTTWGDGERLFHASRLGAGWKNMEKARCTPLGEVTQGVSFRPWTVFDGFPIVFCFDRTDHGDPGQSDHWVAWCQLIPRLFLKRFGSGLLLIWSLERQYGLPAYKNPSVVSNSFILHMTSREDESPGTNTLWCVFWATRKEPSPLFLLETTWLAK